MLDLDVVVNVDLGRSETRELIRITRQWPQGGLVELSKERGARTLHLLEGLLVDLEHQFADHLVELAKTREALLAQNRDDPALCYLHAHFDLGLVAGPVGPRWNDDAAVVSGHLLVGGVDVGFVAVRPFDATAQIVGHQDLGTTPEEFEGLNVRTDPLFELLASGGDGEGIAARTEDRDEELGLETHREIALVIDRNRETRVVDEELLCGLVVLAHDDVAVTSPRAIEMAELGVAVTIGVQLFVFEPQELQRHALDGQLLSHRGEVGCGVTLRRSCRGEESRLERVVVEFLGQRPGETSLCCPTQEEGHSRVGHGE